MIAIAAAAALAVGACGDGDDDALSVDDYRFQLDAGCEQLFTTIQALPQRQLEEDLTSEQVEAAADDAGARFDRELSSLTPPSELDQAHQELVALGDDQPPDDAGLNAFRDYAQRNLEAFEAVGADGCVASEREAIEIIDEREQSAGGGPD